MVKTINSLGLLDFIEVPLRFYSVVGIKMFQWDDSDYMTNREKLVFVLLGLNLILNFIAKSLYFVLGEFADTTHLTQWVLYYMFANNGFCKMLSVAFGRKKLYTVLKDVDMIFPQTMQERRDFRLMECYKYIMRNVKIMSVQHLTIAFMFIVFPIVQSTIEYWSSSGDGPAIFVPRTPYIMVYPFDITHGIGYKIAYFSQLMGGFTISCYFMGSDLLLICAIYLVIMQYDYLCWRIEHFVASDYDKDMKEVRTILERHNLLNNLAKTINEVFSISILLNYMISILIIVMIGIQITAGSDFGLDLIKFVGFFMSATAQMYHICNFGTLLMEYSSRVSESLIGQEWYMTNVRYQRMLVLAIARAQRPSHLTAFKFFDISMETFSNLMTTAYQLFTLLKAQMEEQ